MTCTSQGRGNTTPIHFTSHKNKYRCLQLSSIVNKFLLSCRSKTKRMSYVEIDRSWDNKYKVVLVEQGWKTKATRYGFFFDHMVSLSSYQTKTRTCFYNWWKTNLCDSSILIAILMRQPEIYAQEQTSPCCQVCKKNWHKCKYLLQDS